MDFEEAKRQVAERRGFKSFAGLLAFGDVKDVLLYREAAELLANEAVKG